MALFAIIVGELLGDLVSKIEFLSFLSKSFKFSFSPTKIDFQIFAIVLGFSFHINIIQIILCVIMVILYPKVAKWFKL